VQLFVDYLKLWFIRLTANPGKTHASSQPLDAQSALHKMQTHRQLYVDNFPKKAPSTLAVASEFAKLQGDKQYTIHWNRPPSAASSIPPTLLHPIFGKFIDDCDDHEPTVADNKLVWKLSTAMPEFFHDEDTRASEFRGILRDSGIDTSATTIEGTKFKTDGDIQSRGCRLAIIEVKNEIGSKGAEPHAQSILYYFHSTQSSVAHRPGFGFPCILITLFGKLSIFRR